MKTRTLWFAAFSMLVCCLTAYGAEKKSDWAPLFNGEDFEGWTFDLDDDEAKIQDVWSVKEGGVLACTGTPKGVLRTKKNYSNYEMELEWRWPGEGGNNGVLVHSGDPRTLGIWPRSIEVQLASTNAGDFFDIGTDCDAPDEETRRKGRKIPNLHDEIEKPLGQWNHMRIRCQRDTVTVWVNGKKINECTNIKKKDTDETITSGAISLQSEGRAIEYRKIHLRPLK